MIDCTKTTNYFNEKLRMTKRTRDGVCHIKCEDCPLGSMNNGINVLCADFETIYPKKAVEAIQKWSDEHHTLLSDDGTPEAAEVTDKELELINAYSRRKLTKDEVYVFGVVLCDNDIDRDNERFTVESLFELEKLFVGKTGIFDHSPTAKTQTARIFACSVESVDGKKTATGDDYFRLTARAYIPKAKGNDEIIQAIDSGILKEVGIGCAADEVKCSVCGESLNHCSHIKGETYGGRKCYGELCGICDVYEWSFVAVPVQRSAGVIKSFKGKEMRV